MKLLCIDTAGHPSFTPLKVYDATKMHTETDRVFVEDDHSRFVSMNAANLRTLYVPREDNDRDTQPMRWVRFQIIPD